MNDQEAAEALESVLSVCPVLGLEDLNEDLREDLMDLDHVLLSCNPSPRQWHRALTHILTARGGHDLHTPATHATHATYGTDNAALPVPKGAEEREGL